ncbi:siderophore-interacting protein [Streptomyces physcomitrii]|uniref:siderophore-interacting protein n=1 Tax=Streptomyces physcomitrii TaxID=2724184 RepID=UPI003404E4BD
MTTTAETPVRAFDFFAVRVVRTRELSAGMRRVTFGGRELTALDSGGRDQSASLFLPHPGQRVPVLPADLGESTWFAAWRELPESVRAVMRSYTLRAQRPGPDGGEVDIDFALHGDGGPASRWAARAEPGDRALLLGPRRADNLGVRFRPPGDADLVVLYADETALPAAAAILESLPAGARVRAWLEVAREADRLPLDHGPEAELTWLVRESGAPSAAEAVAAGLPDCAAPYAWIAGESGSVKALRRQLVRGFGIDRRRVAFVGYWRRGLSEEQLREAAE